ncbi:energy transducer TonB [Flavobacterium cellulosilyticum]|uniref:Energy transducer TonB n=1 Tax=Flavobacterium cellulosilyticum TaxID=2541731 RepID=A0A4R5CBE3_9FLAO|nr:energy transducer TonB [Flavobacterium cellulosilyticum]TDD95550.1 energy transducer TonB [Flavobacterium cellulosilyticum]
MMILETEHEKKSFAITTAFFILLFLLLLFMKLTIDPIPDELEGGGGGGEIAINFGNSAVGSGKNYRSKNLSNPIAKSVPIKTVSQEEKILTQETSEAPVISQTKNTERVVTPKPVVKEAPKPSKSTSDALSSLLNGSNSAGDGNDRTGGNKGKLSGDPNAKGYSGGGGSGSGTGGGNGSGSGLGSGGGYGNGSGSGTGNGNYQLGNRKALNTPEPRYLCNEQGTVVVQIAVDQNGKVTSANPGVKGTTNTAKCLLDQAKIAAMNTKWQSDDNAPSTQIGKIIYNFKLTQ